MGEMHAFPVTAPPQHFFSESFASQIMNVVNFRDDALMIGMLEYPYQTFTEEYSFLPPRQCALCLRNCFKLFSHFHTSHVHEVEGWKTHLDVICEDIVLEKSKHNL